jgi:UDP-N-acetyl-D-glucosamine/UDP-N-acetyl-D-galactosamine dehydrogenase
MKNIKIAVIGLGYVGLPLAVEFAKKYGVVGFDINTKRVAELRKGIDETLEITNEQLSAVLVENAKALANDNIGLLASSDIKDIALASVYIVTVPTPIDKHKRPDLSYLISASKMIATVLKKEDIVIYESTVYPGCTEEDCVPVLEKYSGLKFNKEFFCGYSPERINPGDKINTISTIKKVTSGSNPEIGEKINNLYKSIITAGTHLAPSIKVAEASKAIENAQRDVNISFVNELALIFDLMNIDTHDVLAAANTKWNFLPFKPGLVGGHCISVDPYYLAHKAESLGYHPAVILSGRKVNDEMGIFVATKVIKIMISKGILIKNSNVLILGITFKENCPDIRNTKVIDIYKELNTYGVKVDVNDPWANKNDVMNEYGIELTETLNLEQYQAIILTVAHNQYTNLNLNKLNRDKVIVFDTKSLLDKALVDGRL